jgi:hypothetical protein
MLHDVRSLPLCPTEKKKKELAQNVQGVGPRDGYEANGMEGEYDMYT